jgi:hypothetical protein
MAPAAVIAVAIAPGFTATGNKCRSADWRFSATGFASSFSNVDISPAGVSEPALARRTDVTESLIRLGLCATGAFAAVGAGYELVRLLIERTSESSIFAMFGGWQLDVMAAGLGALVLGFLVVSAIAIVRIYRALRGKTPHRRAVVMAALLPGLFIGGGLAGSPLRSAISWASDHTATAQKARAEFQAILPTNPEAPPILFPGVGTPASPAIAARLLHGVDLGAGWYDGQRTNPSERPGSLQGETLSARSSLTQWHWTGTMWSPGDIVSESLMRFSTFKAAQQYFAIATRDATTPSRIAGVPLFEHVVATGSVKSRAATFVVGTDVFSLISIGTESDQEFNVALPAAVRRATAGH